MPDLTDEQQEQLLRSITNLGTAAQDMAAAFTQAFIPAVQALAGQFAEFQRLVQETGALDGPAGQPAEGASTPR